MSLETVAVSTESLQIRRVVVPSIPVNVVYIQLTDVLWLEVAVLAVVLLVDCVRVPALDDIASVYRVAPVSVGDW